SHTDPGRACAIPVRPVAARGARLRGGIGISCVGPGLGPGRPASGPAVMLAALPRLAALTSMHRLLPRAGLLVAGLLALPGSAQETVAPRAATLGTEPLDGVLPGTKRFNVVFHDRKFTLDEFRAAVAAGRPAEEVERIVARLQAMAEAERAGFRARIEELGGRVHLTFWLIDACAIEIDPAKVEQVRALPGVARVDP